MISLAKRMGISPFWVGAAIGLMINLSFLPLSNAQVHAQPGIGITPEQPVELWTDEMTEEWANWYWIQRAIWTAAFASPNEPSMWYRMDAGVGAPGVYSGVNDEGTAFSLEVQWRVAIPLGDDDPFVTSINGEATAVWGVLHGPAGSVPVVATVYTFDSQAVQPRDHLLLLDDIMDPEMAAAIQNLASHGIGTDEMGLLAADFDTNRQAVGSTSVAECIANAVATAAAAHAVAAAVYAACKAGVSRARIAALARCARILFIPKIGLVGGGICAAAVIAVKLAAQRACSQAYRNAVSGINQTLAAAILFCLATGGGISFD